ncbi:CapA family protein [Candidatus Villigracilis affinis]|uniref:CapA family protein n=1 Tax=Candidatus Villigracilis affinis TaxID=3140682 RepID=UPI002A202823|nr:CapA family protein [Anaerolineales bacterium]
MKKILVCFICLALLAACAPATSTPVVIVNTTVPSVTPPPAVTNTPMPSALWIHPGVPAAILEATKSWGIPVTNDPALATNQLDISDSGSLWIYALVAPFPTVTDDVAYQDLLSTWKGVPTGPLNGHSVLLAESTLRAFAAVWGEPASGAVRSVPSGELLDTAWRESAWAIIPFEEIQPKWKVLSVDGQSPLRKNFDADAYPLKIHFGLTQADAFALPSTNRDPSKLTTVILTGVTALVRATAVTMELRGVTFPAEFIRDVLREADITHISNEVTFDKDCPYPSSGYRNFILCSDPSYMELLQDVGVDVVEVTGDHLRDRGEAALLDTLAIYKANNLPYYGGGINAEDARQPVLMEVNGNKIAFMGCNGKREGKYPKAGVASPGPALCDYDFFGDQMQALKAQGYNVIFTFQHEECYSPGPCYTHEEGFRRVADEGATVVSGSQAHFPHVMEFHGDAFIHYGLGNMFFDQMTYILPNGETIDETRREFHDRHIFYDGRYLGVELLTSMLEDYSRPRPMTDVERAAFLSDYFYYSGWMPLQPTPVPQPTVTLTPIALP